MTGPIAILTLLLAALSACAAQECSGIYADSLAHPSDCGRYYNLYLMSCPDGELYDTSMRRCVAAAESACGQTTSGTVPTEPVSTTPTTTTTPTVPTEEETPTTEEETPTTEEETPTTEEETSTTVDWETTETTWIDTTTSAATTTTSGVPTEGSTTPAPTRYPCPAEDDPVVKVRYAHETDCTLYYLCVSGTATLHRCANAWHFSPVPKACRAPEEAACDRCPPTGVARLPHESDCDLYYRCENGVSELYACPAPYYFSRGERVCVTPEEAWCTLDGLSGSTPQTE